MDRVISLLAALVGLIALAGAILVELHGQSERAVIATELASIKTAVADLQRPTTEPEDDGTIDALLALQDRIAALEKGVTAQPVIPPTANAAPGAGDSAITADGPTTDCIPIGTRFMASVDDETAICKTDVVVKITDIIDGTAMVDGAGAIAAGAFGRLGFGGCTVMVFSADLASGFAELRVTCQ